MHHQQHMDDTHNSIRHGRICLSLSNEKRASRSTKGRTNRQPCLAAAIVQHFCASCQQPTPEVGTPEVMALAVSRKRTIRR